MLELDLRNRKCHTKIRNEDEANSARRNKAQRLISEKRKGKRMWMCRLR